MVVGEAAPAESYAGLGKGAGSSPAWLEPPAGARKRRKATVKIRKITLLRFLPLIQYFCKGDGKCDF